MDITISITTRINKNMRSRGVRTTGGVSNTDTGRADLRSFLHVLCCNFMYWA
ncbi:hypothetical protein I7I48_10049 [Histoplasma ohiense]|nr:hypothetical protein I7I48_10049 [Histoplasma ohiense (nom. inval.)]